MKTELTPQEKALMPVVRDEWIDRFFNTKEIDKEKFENGIKWIYNDLLKKPTPKIVYCDGWISCLIVIAILKQNDSVWDSVSDSVRASVSASVWDSVSDSVRASVRASVWYSVWDSVRASVSASVWDSVWDSVNDSVRASVSASVSASVWDSVSDSVRASVWDSVSDSVRASVSASVWDSVSDSVRDSVRDSVSASVWDSVWDSVRDSVSEYSGYCSNPDNAGWASFYDFFHRIGVEDHSKFKKYSEFIKSCVFQTYEYDNIVFAIQPLQTIERNPEGQLHCVDGPAAMFKDGFPLYFVNGRKVEPELIEKPISFDQFQKEDNEDVRAAMITIIKEKEGQDGLLKFLDAQLIDERKVHHNEDYWETLRLYKTKEIYSFLQDRHGNMGQPYCWSEMTCPSTGQTYLIENSADFEDAIEAAKFLRPSFVPADLKYQWTQFAN